MPELATDSALADDALALDVLPPALPEVEMDHEAEPDAEPEAEADLEQAAVAVEEETAAIEESEPDGIAFDHNDSKALIQCIRGLQEGQTQQTQLIQKLHKTVLNTRTIINELILTQNELKDEIEKLKSSTTTTIGSPATTVATCENCHKAVTLVGSTSSHSSALPPLKPTTTANITTATANNNNNPTPDEEIDAIIEARQRKNQWPVKHSTLNCFSVQQDLVKLRFHHSEKYQHIPVRIPKTDKNKDGTKPCKLCSEGKVRRKTTWMCATCEVPLCTRPLMGEEPSSGEGGGITTHHARWHTARDLVAEHLKVHASLKEGRESRKRGREESLLEERDDGVGGVGQEEEEEGDVVVGEEIKVEQDV
ncbi:hypothetical protein HJC23_012548 [Cyclotella cryptica]|uniref:PiggyBac transposable element-derived protein 4 C-terminal zinc-ribbon domain-containing protein n=1 Tax=Cyclotella cryptica TaxID=29204 RepID=A0ABD3QR94_9STRA|eukprot:CCRYP_003201-RA/>CCRYP_003201-RA protein AED:0.09 eAED:0.09 QI:170/1/1/1/0/0/2/175/365